MTREKISWSFLSICKIRLYENMKKYFLFPRILAIPLRDYNLTVGESVMRESYSTRLRIFGPVDAIEKICKNNRKLTQNLLTNNLGIRYDRGGV
jgi:hypothetical protein